jgi:galactose mutarotase-like enzyme
MDITIISTSCSATISTKGAELKSFQDVAGDEYMWQGDPAYWGKTAPILFPNVGVLPNNEAVIGGKSYPLRRHGFARDMEFRVMYQSTDRVTLCLSSNAETKREFPFSFMFQVSYYIHDCTLDVKFDVLNTGDETMFYKIGGHPAFNCPVTEGDRFENYRIIFEQPETASCPVMNLDTQLFSSENRVPLLSNETEFRLNYDLFSVDALVFDSLSSKQVTLSSILTGRGVEMRFDGFSTLGIWTPPQKQAPFVCLEPWAGCAVQYPGEDGTFEGMHGIQSVKPDEKNTHSYSISLL